LVNELLIWSIETGLMTSVASVAALICFHTMEFNYIWFAVYLPLANLYSNAVLASLNARFARRQRLGLVVHSSESPIRFASMGSSSNSTSTARSSRRTSNEVPRSSGTSIIWSSSSSSLSSRRSTIASSVEARTRLEAADSASGSSSHRRSTVAGSGVREKKFFDSGVRNIHTNGAPPDRSSPITIITTTTATASSHQHCAYATSSSINENGNSGTLGKANGNGRKRAIGKEPYIFSRTVRPRAASRLVHPGHSRHSSPMLISPIREGSMF
jgi:hypothetical protein